MLIEAYSPVGEWSNLALAIFNNFFKGPSLKKGRVTIHVKKDLEIFRVFIQSLTFENLSEAIGGRSIFDEKEEIWSKQ